MIFADRGHTFLGLRSNVAAFLIGIEAQNKDGKLWVGLVAPPRSKKLCARSTHVGFSCVQVAQITRFACVSRRHRRLTFFGKPHLINWTKFLFVHNAGLTQLSLLDLARNNLAQGAVGINKDTFKRLIRLRELDLTTNKLNRLDAAIFKDLYELQVREKNFFLVF